MNPLQSVREYEALIYRLPQESLSITQSTLIVIQRGRHFAQPNLPYLIAEVEGLVQGSS